jgi:DNA-binding protein Fis
MRVAATVARMMIARDPRQASDTVLEYLITITAARGAALYQLHETRNELLVGRGIAQDSLDWSLSTFASQRARLVVGDRVHGYGRMLIPLLRSGDMLAVLYLGADSVEPQTMAELSELLIDAARNAAASLVGASQVDQYLEGARSDDVERRQLLVLLDRHEWNLSRVARQLGVSRVTVYKRMGAHGIERKRILKSLPRREPSR